MDVKSGRVIFPGPAHEVRPRDSEASRHPSQMTLQSSPNNKVLSYPLSAPDAKRLPPGILLLCIGRRTLNAECECFTGGFEDDDREEKQQSGSSSCFGVCTLSLLY